jgi:hypothetical protein
VADGELILFSQRRWGGRGPGDRSQIAEEVIRRRNRGEKWTAISADLGLSQKTLREYFTAALRARLALAVDDYRAHANDRLDETQAEIQAQIDRAQALARMGIEGNRPGWVERGIALENQALALQLRLEERRAKLNGLDAPVRVDVEHHVHDGVDEELAAMLRRADQEESSA